MPKPCKTLKRPLFLVCFEPLRMGVDPLRFDVEPLSMARDPFGIEVYPMKGARRLFEGQV